jgi:hypothetical protein
MLAVFKDFKALLVYRDLLVLKVPQVLSELVEPLGQPVPRVPKVFKVILDHRVPLAWPVLLVLKELQVLLVLKEFRAFKVLQVPSVRKVLKDSLVSESTFKVL